MILQVLASIIPIVFLIVLGFFLHEKKYLSKGLDKNLTFCEWCVFRAVAEEFF